MKKRMKALKAAVFIKEFEVSSFFKIRVDADGAFYLRKPYRLYACKTL